MRPGEAPLSVEALQREADRIQAWLASGCLGPLPPPSWPEPLAGGKENQRLRRALEPAAGGRAEPVPGEAVVTERRSTLHGPTSVEARLRQAVEEEAALEARLEADSRERHAELAALYSELQATADRWHTEVGLQEAEHAQLQRENDDLLEDLTAAAVECRGAWPGQSCQLQLPPEHRRGSEAAAEVEGLQREIVGRARQARALALRLAACEERLAAQPSAADAGAQRDVLRALQRVAARLSSRLRASMEEAHSLEEAAAGQEASAEAGRQRLLRQRGGAGAEALVSVQKHLVRLRHMYVAMGRRCEGFEHRLGNEEDLFADRKELLAHSECQLQELSGELSAAELRCAGVRREEARLEAAAEQDRRALEELRRQLQRSDARNAGLEVEAKLLGLTLDDLPSG